MQLPLPLESSDLSLFLLFSFMTLDKCNFYTASYLDCNNIISKKFPWSSSLFSNESEKTDSDLWARKANPLFPISLNTFIILSNTCFRSIAFSAVRFLHLKTLNYKYLCLWIKHMAIYTIFMGFAVFMFFNTLQSVSPVCQSTIYKRTFVRIITVGQTHGRKKSILFQIIW